MSNIKIITSDIAELFNNHKCINLITEILTIVSKSLMKMRDMYYLSVLCSFIDLYFENYIEFLVIPEGKSCKPSFT